MEAYSLGTVLAVGFPVIVLAGLTYGLTGFGFALVSTPILVTFLAPRFVVPMVGVLGIANGLIIFAESRRFIQWRRIWPLMLAGVAGVPAGVYFLTHGSTAALKIFIGVIISLTALAFILGFERPVSHERLGCVPIGLVSGFLNGSTGMSGPPVILFFTNQKMDKRAFRANLVAYFMVLNVFTYPLYALNGLFTVDVLRTAALLLPALGLGTFAGIRLARRVDDVLFRRITLGLVFAAGLTSILSGSGVL